MTDPNDTMTIDELISWAEDLVRESVNHQAPLSTEEVQRSIAYSLVAIAKIMRQDQVG